MDVLENEEVSTVNFIKEGVRIGVLLGAFSLILTFGSYFAGIDTFVSVTAITAYLPYIIITLLVYGFQLRKKNGGYMTFQEGLKYCFIAYVIVELMLAVGTIVLYMYIDPDLTRKVAEASKEKFMALMERMGQDVEKFEEEYDKAGEQQTNFRIVFLGLGLSLIWNFIKSLLISLILRRNPPPF